MNCSHFCMGSALPNICNISQWNSIQHEGIQANRSTRRCAPATESGRCRQVLANRTQVAEPCQGRSGFGDGGRQVTALLFRLHGYRQHFCHITPQFSSHHNRCTSRPASVPNQFRSVDNIRKISRVGWKGIRIRLTSDDGGKERFRVVVRTYTYAVTIGTGPLQETGEHHAEGYGGMVSARSRCSGSVPRSC